MCPIPVAVWEYLAKYLNQPWNFICMLFFKTYDSRKHPCAAKSCLLQTAPENFWSRKIRNLISLSAHKFGWPRSLKNGVPWFFRICWKRHNDWLDVSEYRFGRRVIFFSFQAPKNNRWMGAKSCEGSCKETSSRCIKMYWPKLMEVASIWGGGGQKHSFLPYPSFVQACFLFR